MYSFSAEVGSRGYHVYRNTSWHQIYVNQAVVVHKEKSIVSLQIDPYCYAITITRVDKIGPVTVNNVFLILYLIRMYLNQMLRKK